MFNNKFSLRYQKYLWIVFLFIAIIPVIIYFYYIFKYTVNIPVSDDYGIGLYFLNNFTGADLVDKLKVFYAQHNEHRILFSKGIVLLNYWIEGDINFKVLIIIANLGLAAVGFVLFKSLPPSVNKWLLLIPITYFLFQLQHWENAAFGTACIQNLYIVSFCLYSIYALNQPGQKWFLVAIIFAIVATFTSGSGIITFIIGVVPLLIGKSYRKAAIWVACGTLVAFIYFHDLIPAANARGILQTLVEDGDKAFVSFFAFLGGSINFDKPWEAKGYPLVFSIVLGYLINIFFFYLIFIRYYHRNKVLFYFFLLLLLNSAAIVIVRLHLYPVDDFPTISRYKIITISLLVVCLLICVDLINDRYKKLLVACIVLLSMIYNYVGFVKNVPIFKVHNARLLRTSWLIHHDNDYSGIVDIDPTLSTVTLKTAQSKGIYQIPDLSDEYIMNTFRSSLVNLEIPPNPIDTLIESSFELLRTSDHRHFAIKNGWAFISGRSSGGNTIFVVLKSDNNQFVFNTEYQYRDDVTENYRKTHPTDENNYNDSGFSFLISASGLAPDRYTLGIVIVTPNNEVHQMMSEQEININ